MNNTSKRMSFDMNEILISERALMIPYLINGDVVFSEEEIYDENARRIPFKEELYPYNMAMYDYLSDHGIDIPRDVSAGNYLRRIGRMDDFYLFWHEEAVERLEAWFRENGPNA